MSFFKILGGVAIGVGAVAAAPFTGGGSLIGAATLATSLAGAGTIAAAATAGVAGAAIGASMGSDDDDLKELEKKAAKYEKKYEKLASAFESAETRINETSDYFDLIIAMEAVALACAACDGEVAPEERVEIDEFIAGVTSSDLPQHIKQKIEEIAKNPPNIHTAYELASKIDPDSFEVFNEIIEVVMHADGHIHANEKAFLQAWNQLAVA